MIFTYIVQLFSKIHKIINTTLLIKKIFRCERERERERDQGKGKGKGSGKGIRERERERDQGKGKGKGKGSQLSGKSKKEAKPLQNLHFI